MKYQNEIQKRRTFAIISHPDAGKTTLTEKLLLFGGAIQVAGAVKSNKIKKHATSDFMEIERQRGISVATSVMSFEYKNILINLLDINDVISPFRHQRLLLPIPAEPVDIPLPGRKRLYCMMNNALGLSHGECVFGIINDAIQVTVRERFQRYML